MYLCHRLWHVWIHNNRVCPLEIICGVFFFLFAKKVCSVCTGVKPYACSMCDMRFFQRYHLARHTLTHTGTCLFSPPSDLTMRRSVRVSRPHPNCQSTGTQTPFHCALPTRLCPLLTYFHCCGQVLFPVPGRLWVQAWCDETMWCKRLQICWCCVFGTFGEKAAIDGKTTHSNVSIPCCCAVVLSAPVSVFMLVPASFRNKSPFIVC